MQQTLFYIPEKLGGLPVFGLGILFAVWLAFSAILLAWLVRRQGWNEDTKGYLPILFMFGVGILFVAPYLMEATGLPIRGYGVMVTLGVVSGVGLSAWQARRMGLDPEVIFSLAFWMFAAGIGGARMFFVIQYWHQFQAETTWQTLVAVANITKGGLVVYGSVLGGLAALVVFCRVRKLPALAIGDLIAPGMLVGLAFGRVGCLLNGCCYGGMCEDNNLPAVSFPRFADVQAGKVSDPYAHQQALGLLNGFRLTTNERQEVVVASVLADSSADKSGLKAGDIVRRIDLDPFAALFAARFVPELAGGELEIQTESKKLLAVPIVPRRAPVSAEASANVVGFELAMATSSRDAVIVESIAARGPADQAGLKPDDRIVSLHLPLLSSLAAAHGVLQHANQTVVLETAGGIRHDVSLDAFPPRSRRVHPTQIYSVVKASLLALFLYAIYPFRRRDGEVFAWMLTLYPPFRILLEVIRDDVPGLVLPGIGSTSVTISQAVSGGILLLAIGVWIYLWRQPPGSVLPAKADPAP